MVEDLMGAVGAPIIYKDHFPGSAKLNQDFADSLAKIQQGLRLIEHRHDNRYVDGVLGCLIFKKLRHYPPILRKSVKTEFFPQNLKSISGRDSVSCQSSSFGVRHS